MNSKNDYPRPRYPRTLREAFQNKQNPVATQRQSEFLGDFEHPSWILIAIERWAGKMIGPAVVVGLVLAVVLLTVGE